MGKIEVNIQKSIYDKLQEMSDVLKIDLDELINLIFYTNLKYSKYLK